MKEMLRRLYELNRKSKTGERMTRNEADELCLLLKRAGEFISTVDNDFARYSLTERYINAKPWRRVADELGVLSDDTVRKCCARAVEKHM